MWSGILLFCFSACRHQQESTDVALSRAESARILGRPDWERVYLQEALALSPLQPEWLLALGRAQLAGFEGSVSQAIIALEKSLELAPEASDVKLELAGAYLLKGDQQRATDVLNNMPQTLAVSIKKAEILQQHDATKAWQLISQVLATAPEMDKPYGLAAKTASLVGKWDTALGLAEKAHAKQPFDPSHVYVQVRALGFLKQPAKQKEASFFYEQLKTYQAMKPHNQAEITGKLAALEELGDIWQADPSSHALHLRYWQLRAGREKSLGDLLPALGTSVRLDQVEQSELVMALVRVGNYGEAEAVLNQGVRQEALTIDQRLLQAQIDFYAKRFERLIENLTQLLQKQPGLAPAYYWRAKAHLWQVAEDAARQDFENAVLFAPWFVSYRLELAELLLSLGEQDQVRTLLGEDLVNNHPQVISFKKANGL